MSACASSSVNGSSRIADQMSRPARCEQRLQEGLLGRFLAPEGQQREHAAACPGAAAVPRAARRCRRRPIGGRRCRRRAAGESPPGGTARATRRMRGGGERTDRRCLTAWSRRTSAMAGTCRSTGNTRVKRVDVGRHQGLDVVAWERAQVAAEIVDHAVERLVWNGLVLVAPTREDDDLAACGRSGRGSSGRARSCQCLKGHRRRPPPRSRSVLPGRPRAARRADSRDPRMASRESPRAESRAQLPSCPPPGGEVRCSPTAAAPDRGTAVPCRAR